METTTETIEAVASIEINRIDLLAGLRHNYWAAKREGFKRMADRAAETLRNFHDADDAAAYEASEDTGRSVKVRIVWELV